MPGIVAGTPSRQPGWNYSKHFRQLADFPVAPIRQLAYSLLCGDEETKEI
jgi:hypothetical protein